MRTLRYNGPLTRTSGKRRALRAATYAPRVTGDVIGGTDGIVQVPAVCLKSVLKYLYTDRTVFINYRKTILFLV